jgi:hypothetical protein
MMNLKYDFCQFNDCTKYALYGYKFNKKIYCQKHALPNMLNLKYKICLFYDCKNKAIFNKNHQKNYCQDHE